MTQIGTPISFIATDDAAKAQAFYGDVLGLELVDASPYALAFKDGDLMLRVQIVEGFQPVGYTVHGWQVSDISGQIAQLTAKGVTFEGFAHLDHAGRQQDCVVQGPLRKHAVADAILLSPLSFRAPDPKVVASVGREP